MDEVHVCVLRALAADETPAERAEHALDISLLDAMTWPQYVWELLRLTGGGGGQICFGKWGAGNQGAVAQEVRLGTACMPHSGGLPGPAQPTCRGPTHALTPAAASASMHHAAIAWD